MRKAESLYFNMFVNVCARDGRLGTVPEIFAGGGVRSVPYGKGCFPARWRSCGNVEGACWVARAGKSTLWVESP